MKKLVLASLSVGLTLVTVAPARADSVFLARLNGSQEGPPNASIASGLGNGQLLPCPTTLTVTTTNDSGTGSLREAIFIANTCPGTNLIQFAPSAFGTILLTSGELFITDHLMINGPGPAIVAVDGNAAGRIFHIAPSNTVTIVGLTITNGYAVGRFPADAGGGIYNDHATLTLFNCSLNGNSADSGGGIFNNGVLGRGTLTIADSTLSGNSANSGGGIYNEGLSGLALLRFTNSTLWSNAAIDLYGGGIYNHGSRGRGEVAIEWSTVSANSAQDSGGGIFNNAYQGSTTLTMTNSTVSDNSAGAGGGIYNDGEIGGSATVAMANSALSGNSACVGGGIVNDGVAGGATLMITNSTLSGNSASTGGGIFNDSRIGSTSLQITSTTVSGNSATLDGGGLFIEGRTGTASVQIASSTLGGNSALGGSGGGIYNQGSTLSIASSTLTGNSAAQHGGGILSDGRDTGDARLQVVNSTLSGNSASFSGSGIYSDGRGGSASLQIGSTILKAGAAGENIASASTTITSLGYNLSSDNGGGVLNQVTDQINTEPKLGPLQDNGGLTFTHALTCGSPAIDRGKNFSGSATDQRGVGFTRIFDDPAVANAPGSDGTDIGAFEAQAALPGCDRPPLADASATAPLVISPSGINAVVILDGSRSSDPDGDPLHYTWSEIGNATPLASGVVAVVVLPVGPHVIRLVVSDGILADTNTATIEIITAAQAVARLVAAVNVGVGVSHSASLRATLAVAIASIDGSNPVSAINQLLAFQNQVCAQVAPLDPDLAETFIEAAQEIIDVLSGGNTNPGGRPHGRFTAVARQSNGHVRMQFSAEPAGTYIIESSSDLLNWEMIGVAVPRADGGFEFEDGQTAMDSTRFYRVRAL